jgi:hypothetical protein
MAMIADPGALAQAAIDLTSSYIDTYGPRLTTSQPCTQVAHLLHDRFAQSCDSAYAEEFQTTPYGMPNITRFMLVGYVCGLFFLWLNLPLITAILQGFVFVMFVFEFLFYWEILDPLTPKRTATNVYGVVEPTHAVKNLVIFSGHHDSTHIFNFFADTIGKPRQFMVREILFVLLQVAELAYAISAAATGAGCGFRSNSKFHWGVIVCFTIALRVVLPFWHFLSPIGTPGAGDNLISSAMAVQLAAFYGKNKPKHTRLMFMSFDAEELGLKGSRVFFRKHKAKLAKTKTWNFNVDCPYTIDELKFLTRDVNGFVGLSQRFANKLLQIAHDLGYADARTCPIMFLGGGTDAGEAARAGVEATTVLGLPFAPLTARGKQAVYHTHLDTIESVEPEIVKATVELFGRFIADLDSGAWPL